MHHLRRSLIALAVCAALLVGLATTLVLSAPHASHATGSLSLTFTCAQAVDNQSGSVCVRTVAGVALTIKIRYCSGYYATSGSLKGTKHANASGNYTWHWVPQTTCRGPATATVKATLSGQTVTKSDTFTVQ